MKTKEKSNSVIKYIFGGLSAVLLVGIFIPLVLPDGTGGYSSVEQGAARAGIDYLYGQRRGIDGISTLGGIKLRVESVTSQPGNATAETLCNNGFTDNSSDDSPEKYIVSVSTLTLFGITMRTDDVRICRTSST